MEDFKIAHLLHASPKPQFYGQMVGTLFGVIFTPLVYRLYVAVYELPSKLFEMPGAYIWIFTARLLTGSDPPPDGVAFWSHCWISYHLHHNTANVSVDAPIRQRSEFATICSWWDSSCSWYVYYSIVLNTTSIWRATEVVVHEAS
jgi:hypothetical protein